MSGHTCGGCDNRWTGLAMAHCSACHRTFATVSLFDRHRSQCGPRGACLDPESLVDSDGYRVMFHRGGMWRGKEPTEAERLRLSNLSHAKRSVDT